MTVSPAAFILPARAAKPAGTPLVAFLTRLIWLCVLPLVLLAVWLAVDRVLTIKAGNDRAAANLAQNFATAIDQYLSARIAALNMLAESPLLNASAHWQDLYQEAQDFHQSFGNHVILADPGMRMLFYTRVSLGTPLPLLPRPAGHAAAPTALETGQPAVGDTFFGSIAKERLIAIAVPALRESKVTFLVIALLDLHQFQQRLDQVALPSGWALALHDGTHAIIARRVPVGSDPAREVDTAKRVVVQSTLSPWSVVLDIPRDAYHEPLFAAAETLLATILGATLVGVAGGLLASRRLAGAVATLTTASALAVRQPAIREIEQVRQKLDEAAAMRATAERERQQSEAALLDSVATYRSLFDHMLNGLAYCRMVFVEGVPQDFIYLSVNGAFANLTGLTNVVGRTVSEVIPGIRETDPELFEIYGRVSLTGQPEQFERYVNALRMWFWISVYCPQHEHFVAVFDVITERKQAEEEIHRLNLELEERVRRRTAELEAANLELESFAYAVSHDLRAPLRAMSGFSRALEEDYGSQLQGEAMGYLDQIIIASRKMSDLIDGLLVLSRSTQGGLQYETVDMSVLAERLLAELAQGEPERRVMVQVEAGLRAHGDVRMIEVVLRNLLGNAWKYSAHTAAPCIRVYTETRDSTHCFCVADNGAGFDMAHAKRLFQPFQRLHRQEEFPGIGIGLATVQRIVHRHGGEIEAWGEPGRGALFRFSLPGLSVESIWREQESG